MLAIVIPYYKLTFFEETLKSLKAQTNQRFKVYIGDDASPENPNQLLEKYHESFDFLYHRFEENLGGTSLTKQWERCIKLTKDEKWLMILGDDDVLDTNVVEEFYNNLNEVESGNISVIRFSTVKMDENSQITTDVYQHPKVEETIDFLFRKTRTSLSEYIFLKAKVVEIGFKNFPLAWFSDVLAIVEFSDFKRIFTINTAILKIRISNISISGNQDNVKLKSKATFEYYHYLIVNKSRYFNNEQRKILLLKLGKSYINDKKNVGYFFKISKIYWSDFLISDYFEFIKSVIKAFKTRKKNI
ncbi:glycosyltransferase family 2 protein [Flavobacterium sp. ANB]|uniref:glycosyltransferase family 2 protein n=1 Tax=unclassified Flavobacterium TaxID=196869 RepID=UPI0012B6BFCB|nr:MULTISPECIES: glycosyltransferase family 2 protein [unclassified Flavobacterium]MBF4517585.1 glycosyltransferase family 2 protein [Flavobacterium sp. ANB]MTD70312.1 glycosyltransferase [Flavobacterium sp. LC2016-13]